MIKFNNLCKEKPYQLLKEKYDEAFGLEQKSIEAISISSYNKDRNEIDSRFVNLKFILNDEFIFFSNYNSPKAQAFESHNQIAALVYWSTINVQIRMRAKIKKTSKEFNQNYFYERSKEKRRWFEIYEMGISARNFQKITLAYSKNFYAKKKEVK